MSRHTKIVATLGPASSTPEVLERMVQAGIDVVRMNFSHGTPTTIGRAPKGSAPRRPSMAHGRHPGDLQGPKIRVGKFEDGKITLIAGEKFILDAQCPLGNQDASASTTRICPRTSVMATSCSSTTAA
jgi:pyruvate kinase